MTYVRPASKSHIALYLVGVSCDLEADDLFAFFLAVPTEGLSPNA
jgi:hypothetical protein